MMSPEQLGLAEEVSRCAKSRFEQTVARLSEYLRFPAISCDAAHHGDVLRLAQRIAGDLGELGFDTHVRQLPGALPLVAAERRSGVASAPTLLIYGHLDLQPVRGEAWSSPPHEAVRRPTPSGPRLYARGAADDMGGWVSHLAALEAWLEVHRDTPLHMKLLIEGEEEIGSPNLERYMDAFPEDFAADAMVLTDCENPAVDMPGLTVSLRGLYELEIHCEALESDIHSGLWGNMAPDVSTTLMRLISSLVDDDGRPRFGRVVVPPEFQSHAREIPLGPEVIRSGAHLAAQVAPLPLRGAEPAEWLWRQPALTILSTTLPRPEEHKNALRRSASAVLSIRVPPGRTKEELRREIDALIAGVSHGGTLVRIVERSGGASSWLYEAKGPVFEAADRAYEKAFGRKLTQIGIGGSIPFVALFGRRYAHLPLILNGVMDPETGAHGPDESLHLGVFERAIVANVWLYAELAAVLR